MVALPYINLTDHDMLHTQLWVNGAVFNDILPFCGLVREVWHTRSAVGLWPVWLDEVWPDYPIHYAHTPHSNCYIWQ